MRLIHQNYQQSLEKYEAETGLHYKTLSENKRQRNQDEADRQAKTMFLQSQEKEIEKSIAVSDKRLKAIYAKNVIFLKYRNLAMVCSLYKYICAGRCTALEGHEGAYNILESEIRLDRIICQMDRVITNLEQIQKNQFMLYSAVRESNRRAAEIHADFQRMESDLTASLEGIYNNTVQINSNSTELNSSIAELQKASALTAYHTERTQKELAYMNRRDYLSGRNDNVFCNHPPV